MEEQRDSPCHLWKAWWGLGLRRACYVSVSDLVAWCWTFSVQVLLWGFLESKWEGGVVMLTVNRG